MNFDAGSLPRFLDDAFDVLVFVVQLVLLDLLGVSLEQCSLEPEQIEAD